MKTLSLAIRLLLPAALGLCLCGCLSLKPARATARSFVLSSLAPDSAAPSVTPPSGPGVGVGPVKLPSYLFRDSVAVRKGASEVEYLENALWAERLDAGFQRVLAFNLATLLPTGQIRLSAWRSSDVAIGVYVALERFDVDVNGQGTIVAWWRVLSSAGDKVLKSGQFRATQPGPAPATNPDGAIATLSELNAALSREVVKAIKEVTAQGTAGT